MYRLFALSGAAALLAATPAAAEVRIERQLILGPGSIADLQGANGPRGHILRQNFEFDTVQIAPNEVFSFVLGFGPGQSLVVRDAPTRFMNEVVSLILDANDGTSRVFEYGIDLKNLTGDLKRPGPYGPIITGEPVLVMTPIGLPGAAFDLTASSFSFSGGSWNLKIRGGNAGLSFSNLELRIFADELEVVHAPVAAVPEPASWALMIGGFGLAGGAARTRRVRAGRRAFTDA